jgi:hypothetical protein
MMMRAKALIVAFAMAALAAPAHPRAAAAQEPATAPRENPYAVGTFESLGLYFRSPDAGEVGVRFRVAGETAWRQGLALWRDNKEGEYRGSIVELKPGTDYEVQLLAGGRTVALAAHTRGDTFAVGKTTTVPPGDSYDPIEITESGTPEAYHLVTVTGGQRSTIDVANTAPVILTIDADYVIVRGLELLNSGQHGILIRKGHHDVIVEDCHIAGWGRVGGSSMSGSPGNMDSGIMAEDSTRNLVFQRNLIENPRGSSNDWRYGHPAGPQAISVRRSLGGNIIRYNTIRATDEHAFNDAIGGGPNFSADGNMNRDSDIYGNYVSNVWDDAMEIEGANANVRIWGNFIEKTNVFLGTATVSRGPMYIFRNVFGESRRNPETPLGSNVIKVGDRGEFGGGRRYVFHNTVLQPRGAFNAYSGAADPVAYSRNNVWDVPGMLVQDRLPSEYPKSDFDYEVYTGFETGMADMDHRVLARPAYADHQGLEFYPATRTLMSAGHKVEMRFRTGTRVITNPVVMKPNAMIDGGVRIPNFNDDFAGAAPDVGAFEVGRPPLKFGRVGIGAPRAPWE